ncbi:hypothetical protein [Paenibacillus ihuae]|uniref:hypothetical protein n=1 Tax=Paenibacillus ihuae TaxID=1232431 RepID=UPI0006D5A312|nr:hypothetical protein [Paenibacillus ihuae]
MSVKLMWRVYLGLIFIVIAGGCSALTSNPEGNIADAGATQPGFSLKVGDNDLTGSSGRQLSDAYKQEITMQELLRNSGLVTFAEDGSTLLTVNKVSLAKDMEWEIQLNDKVITDLNTRVKLEDKMVISAKAAAQNTPFQPVILTVNGGSEQPALTHSYVLPFTENLSVRALLMSSGIIQLAENNKTVLTVKEYKPLTNEGWKLKLNDKTLLDSGIDMKLRIQDELELSLVLR